MIIFCKENTYNAFNLCFLFSSEHNHICSVVCSKRSFTVSNALVFYCLSVTHMAFQRAVNREFTLFSFIFAPSLRPLRFTDQLIPFSSSVAVFIFLHPSLLDLTLSSFPTPTSMHTHKKTHKLTCTPPISQPSLLSVCLDLPPLYCPSSTPLLSLHLPSPSRPEAAAGTCIAGCYVGAMTTVMNSTWRSRIQADVSLCGCSVSNGAHVSRG